MAVLGLIPAKAGSTRLPQKNILDLGGKPLIAWAIEAAQKSGVIDRLVLSTESQEVADIARQYGADVPFIRPEKLAKDPAGVSDVCLHALQKLREQGDEYDTIVAMLPTCPFRSAQDIRQAMQLYQDRQAQFLLSVSEFSHTPFAALNANEQGFVKPFFTEHWGKRSQLLPTAYRPNGAIHIMDVAAFEKAQTYIAEPLLSYVMPASRSIDIDNIEDLEFARFLVANNPAYAPSDS